MMRRPVKTVQFFVLPCALFLVSAVAAVAPIADGDIFWHLAAGREMWRSGQLLHQDPFSVGAAGRDWADVHWLFQLGAFAVNTQFGLTGLVLAKCALVACASCLFLWASPRNARTLTALSLITVLLCARHLLLVRPVIVSLWMLGLFCALLERHRRGQGRAALIWLPLAQIVWSNCQGLSALGPALVAAYSGGALAQRWLAGRKHYPFAPEALRSAWPCQRVYLRGLLACLTACVLASFVTPFGASAISLPWRLLARLAPTAGNPFQQVVENVPSFVVERSSSAELWHLKWFIGLLALSIAARRGRLALSQLLLLIGFTGLALAANRNVLLLYAVGTPIAARQLLPALRLCRYRLRRAHSRTWAPCLSGAMFAVVSCTVAVAAAREPRLDAPTPFHFPVESASAIAAHGGEGHIFSADHHGGYLIWTLYPSFRPYYDTRWILRSSEELSDYLTLADEPARFDAFQAQHPFAYVVLPVAYPSRYLPLAAHLYHSASWRLVFTNGSEVLFANRDLVQAQAWNLGEDTTTDHIVGSLRGLDQPELQSAARMQLAMLDIAVGEPKQAERALAGLREPAAEALRAQARLLAGDLQGAQLLAESLLRAGGDDVRSLTLLANVSIRRQQLPEAFGYLKRAIEIDPFDDEVTQLLRSLEDHAYVP